MNFEYEYRFQPRKNHICLCDSCNVLTAIGFIEWIKQLLNDCDPDWEVVVSHLGSVYHGPYEDTAKRDFEDSCKLSQNYIGRYGGETVYLLKNGEIVDQFTPNDDINYID